MLRPMALPRILPYLIDAAIAKTALLAFNQCGTNSLNFCSVCPLMRAVYVFWTDVNCGHVFLTLSQEPRKRSHAKGGQNLLVLTR